MKSAILFLVLVCLAAILLLNSAASVFAQEEPVTVTESARSEKQQQQESVSVPQEPNAAAAAAQSPFSAKHEDLLALTHPLGLARELWSDLDQSFRKHMGLARSLFGEDFDWPMTFQGGPGGGWPRLHRPSSLIDRIRELQFHPFRSGTAHTIGHADMHEENDAFVITVDVPGLDKKDLQIKVTSDHDTYTGNVWDVIEVDGKRTVERERDIEAPTLLGPSETKEQIAASPETEAPTKPAKPEEQKRKIHFIERSFGEFRRRFVMPKRILHDSVKATVKSGVLRIVAPKMQPQKPDDSDYTQVPIE